MATWALDIRGLPSDSLQDGLLLVEMKLQNREASLRHASHMQVSRFKKGSR